MIMNVREALRRALEEEMGRDENVILMGEEVAQYHGAYKVSQGLLEKYGSLRVIDTPISEEGFTGVGIGAAMAGMRPVVEWMTLNFSLQALDQTYNNAAKMLYMSGGQFNVPIVFRGPNGPAEYLSAQHSQSLQSIYCHCPGLRVVAPSTPADFLGLLKSSIRDNNPVIFLESELMYALKGEVPEEEFFVPLGSGAIRREGKDVTIIGFSKPMYLILEAASKLQKEGIEAEVIDLRTLRPLDEELVYRSVEKTNRCVVVDEAWPYASVGSHLSYLVSYNCFDFLDAPVELVSQEDVPVPYSHALELAALPSVEKVIDAVRRVTYLS